MSEKLQKVLARVGLGSRRHMEEAIVEGRVSVNGKIAEIGQRIEATDELRIDGRRVSFTLEEETRRRVLVYYKPEGEICSRQDPEGRPTVFDNLPPLNGERWVMVGRLDINSSGLLLFTNDGELANRLMHPSNEVEREYAVRVMGEITPEMRQNLLNGVMLEDGPAKFESMSEVGGEGINRWYEVVVKEGRNREVRRMMEAVGHAVSRLIRIRYGAMVLPHGLRRGAWLELDEADIRSLMRAAGTAERPRPVIERPVSRTNRNDRRPRTGGGGKAGTAVPRAKPPVKSQAGGAGAQPDPMKTSVAYIGAESFNRLKKTPGGPGRGGRGGSGRSR